MNQPANSDQLQVFERALGAWWRKLTAVFSLLTVVVISGILIAASIGVLTLVALFVIERAVG